MALCVIPARGGSKRIPNKNSRLFHGKPMICWSIEAAQRAGCFDEIIVSTDCPEIAGIAEAAGASVPFQRPDELADDHAGTMAVVAHAINWMMSSQADWNATKQPVCCLYATAPFALSADIRKGFEKLSTVDYVIPVTTFAHPIQRAVRVNEAGCLEMLDSAKYESRSQDLEETWHDCGQFYWGWAAAWSTGLSPYSMNCLALPIPRWRVQDIDTEEDWIRAERLFDVLSNHTI